MKTPSVCPCFVQICGTAGDMAKDFGPKCHFGYLNFIDLNFGFYFFSFWVSFPFSPHDNPFPEFSVSFSLLVIKNHSISLVQDNMSISTLNQMLYQYHSNNLKQKKFKPISLNFNAKLHSNVDQHLRQDSNLHDFKLSIEFHVKQ